MGRIMTIILILLAIAVVAVGYVRMAPSDVATWHKLPDFTEDRDMKRGVMRVVETGPGGLEQLHAIARATPRTKVLAGSVDEGMITYVTRTKGVGFPDYTTVQQDGDRLRIYARLRFGRSDLGVNRHRVERWLDVLKP